MMAEKRQTYEELEKKLTDAAAHVNSLMDKVKTIISERDSALLGTRELEEAYIESEQNFHNSMDACPLGVRIVTEDGELLYANQAILDIYGLNSLEELKTLPRKQLYTPQSYAEREERIEKRKRGEPVPQEYEINIRRPDGFIRNLLVFRKGVIWGGERRFMAMYQDITERRRAEEALRQSEGKYRELAKSITDVYFALDKNLRYTYWNRASELLTGVTAENALGKYLYDLFPDTEETKKAEVIYRRVLRTKKPEQFINEFHIMDKTYFFEISAYPAKNGLSVFVKDITERKRSEDVLRLQAEIMRNMAEGVVLTRARDAVIVYTNPKFEEMFGYGPGELIGRNISEVNASAEKSPEEVAKDIQEFLKETGVWQGEVYNIRKDGTTFWCYANVSTFNHPEYGTVWVATHTDITERKKAEEALRLQRDFTQSVFDTAQVIMLVLNKDGRIIDFNPYMEEISGYRLEEVRGKYWFDTFVPERDRNKIKRLFERSIDNVHARGNVNPIVTKDGREREIEWYDKTLKDLSGKVVGLLTVGQDVTERRGEEEKHQTILKTALDGFWVVDLNGKILEVNDSYCQMLGYTQEELLKMSIMNVEAIENHEETARHIKKIVLQGSDRFETRQKRKDGQIIDFEVSTNYLDIEQGQIFVFFRDITERKQAAERINHLNLTLRSIRHINQLITREKNRDRLIKGICNNLVESRSFNSVWIALLDESRKLVAWAENGLGKNFSSLLEPLKQGNLPLCVQKAMRQKQVVVTENPHSMCTGCPLQPDNTGIGSMTVRLEYEGNIYGVLCATLPEALLSDKDEVTLFKEAAADISFALHDIELEAERELLEQERLRAAKLESIGTLAGGIAHDFNNLLTGIMGNIGLARTYIKPSDRAFEMLDEAEKAAVRARDLTQQLLTFARGGKPVKDLIKIAELIKESATFALRGSNVRLELSLPGDLWSVEADEGQISQVINNLVINADEAMPAGGILRIGASNFVVKRAGALPLARGNYVRLDVKDMGVGISQEHLERIFEPYFTTKQKGSGLGLTTAYSIVTNHGGNIFAESTLNEGSAFHVYLPASKKAAKEEGKAAGEKPGQAGGKVLVMDDEEIIRKMLSNMLKLAGYEAELTGDGAEALERYAQTMKSGKPFDAVIMDLTVPGGMGGKEAIKKLLHLDPDARVIVSSGYATDPIMSEYKKYGFSAVIAKPYSVKQLEETLRGLSKRKKK
jgi:PAS domain S-box-containing protein